MNDDALDLGIRRLDSRIETLTMQISKLPPRSPSRTTYVGELVGLREARALVKGEPSP